MSELHFDNEGEPAQQHPQCSEVRWRRFRNPGMRGAPEVVHEKDGSPLYTMTDITYLEFRARVEGAPGRYRGDQVDAGRRLIPGATPFYVTINEAPRNAGGGGGGEDRDLIREVVRANVEMTRMIADRFSGMMESAAGMMRQASEILRAADGANLPRREPQLAEPQIEDDQDGEDDDEPGTSGVELVKSITDQMFPLIEMWLMGRAAKTPPAAPAPAVGTQASAVPASSPPPPAQPATETQPGAAASAASAPASPVPNATPEAPEVRNAAPTSEQAQHLMAILQALEPEERKVARAVVQRMTGDQRAHWLGELSALTVEQAVALVRSMIPPRTRKESDL